MSNNMPDEKRDPVTQKYDEALNQMKNYLFDQLLIVRTAPKGKEGEEYSPIFPQYVPGQTLEEHAVRIQRASGKASVAISPGEGAELKQAAGICVDLLAGMLISMLNQQIDENLAKKESGVRIPSVEEIRRLGN